MSSDFNQHAGASNIHINPNFQSTSSELQAKSNIHVNPNFRQNETTVKAHINPSFSKAQLPASIQPPKTHVNPKFHLKKMSEPEGSKTYINPNFVQRPLPEIPQAQPNSQVHINPSFLDSSKTQAYDKTIKNLAESKKILINPKSAPRNIVVDCSLAISSKGFMNEKENISNPSTSSKNNTEAPTSAKKSLFKKIGTRKLILMNKSGKIASPRRDRRNFSKINSPSLSSSKAVKPTPKKLLAVKSVSTPPNRVSSPRVSGVSKKVRTPLSARKSIFSTPFSMKKRRALNRLSPNLGALSIDSSKRHKKFGHAIFDNIFSPFRVDRRVKPYHTLQVPVGTITKPSSIKKLSAVALRDVGDESTQDPVPSTSGSESNPSQKDKKPVPPKPTRKKPSTTLINVQGVRYAVSNNGHKLNRVEQRSRKSDQSTSKYNEEKPKLSFEIIPKKLYLDGEEYVEEEPGVLIRSRNSMTRQSITSYKNRSINTILKSQTRSKQYCMFYNKFGKCNKKDKGICPYIHDQTKVAVCRKFLQANCHNENCLLSHQVAPEKMPSCKFFLQGLCSKESCQYRHVYVNPSAEICKDFLKGFCPSGEDCKKKHSLKGSKPVVMRDKKVPPAKPKRKSMCQNTGQEKKARVRYYDEMTQDQKERNLESYSPNKNISGEMNRNEQELFVKRQGPEMENELLEAENLDESGPYEEIEDDPEVRAPMTGPFPSYIPLESCGVSQDVEANSESENFNIEAIDERLI